MGPKKIRQVNTTKHCPHCNQLGHVRINHGECLKNPRKAAAAMSSPRPSTSQVRPPTPQAGPSSAADDVPKTPEDTEYPDDDDDDDVQKKSALEELARNFATNVKTHAQARVRTYLQTIVGKDYKEAKADLEALFKLYIRPGIANDRQFDDFQTLDFKKINKRC